MANRPSKIYQKRSREFGFQEDPQQQHVLEMLDRLCKAINTANREKPSLLKLFFNKKPESISKGLYIWGGVGRGKTMLMDIFYESINSANKMRIHFHRFMHKIHTELKQHKNRENPLQEIAKELSQNTYLICLDEFHVSDIADAMILTTLLTELIERNIIIVTTSNQKPDDLYKDGLQRSRFIPAIDLIHRHLDVVSLNSPTDYRLLTLKKSNTFFYPLNKSATENMQKLFTTMTTGTNCQQNSITINGREVSIKGEAEGVIWFDFYEICCTPRSQSDYLLIACEHHSIFISNILKLNDSSNDVAKRFLILIDILYDHKVKLIISSASPIDQIYSGRKLSFEFERATSRLLEMQSEKYLSQTHIS